LRVGFEFEKSFFFFSFFVCLPLTRFYGFRLLFKTSKISWLNPVVSHKIKVSFISLIFLFTLTIFTGSHFAKLKDFFVLKIISSFYEKLLVLFLVTLG